MNVSLDSVDARVIVLPAICLAGRFGQRSSIAAHHFFAALIVFQMVNGETGIGTSRMPIDHNASVTAFITAAGEPIAPASPQPLTPSELCVHGVPSAVSTIKCGRSSARGNA